MIFFDIIFNLGNLTTSFYNFDNKLSLLQTNYQKICQFNFENSNYLHHGWIKPTNALLNCLAPISSGIVFDII